MGGITTGNDNDVGVERSLISIAWILVAALWAGPLSAQELGTEPDGARETQRLLFVPRLRGALSIDASVAYRFMLGNDDALPPTSVGGTLGYRHFVDWHGRLSLRGYGALRYGGLGNAAVDGTIWQYGAGVSLHGRSYTESWAFGGIGAYAELLATSWSPPSAILDASPEAEFGYQASFGIETDFGQLITVDPYMFAESSALFGLNYIDVGPWESWSLDARWVVRWDWAWRPSAE